MPLFKKTRYSTVRTAPKKDIPAGLWLKCKGCEGTLYQSSLAENGQVCPKCDFHYPLTAAERIALLTDAGSFQEIDPGLRSVDALQFAGGTVYGGKLQEARAKTGLNDAVVCGTATLEGRRLGLGVMDFRFMGASMGSVVGEKVTRLAELSTREGLPLVIATASGGARMQEGMLSLMQMAKTSAALARHAEAGLPYVVIMTHPTTAGVTASFASLGDVILAEPRALVGFAGPRVIKQTTQSELPPGFQSAEFLQRHGFIDRVVHRSKLRRELALLLEYFSGSGRCQAEAGAV
ncbi:MAG: acetyl-CoA carboxylase carboxyltransferase subunit beta [Lentisphaerae bacterium]|nr:acetyl-CoA carboxylase carboxyltransferase subunit beta [Lentisphaerota bacterium]